MDESLGVEDGGGGRCEVSSHGGEGGKLSGVSVGGLLVPQSLISSKNEDLGLVLAVENNLNTPPTQRMTPSTTDSHILHVRSKLPSGQR